MTLHFVRAKQAIRVLAIVAWLAPFAPDVDAKLVPSAVILWMACAWRIGANVRALVRPEE